jgi:type II secretory pathway component GspD/PulD (secretin)
VKCDEYLHLLSTSPVEELTEGRAGDHLASCAECNRVTRLVVDRDRNMVSALAGMSSQVQPFQTAHVALNLSRRRRLATLYIGGLVLLLFAVGAVVLTRSVVPIEQGTPAAELFTEVFNLKCIAPMDMADLLRAKIASRTGSVVGRMGSHVLTVRGTVEDIQKARAAVDQYDNAREATCVLPQMRP